MDRLDRVSTAAFLDSLGGSSKKQILLARLLLRRGHIVPHDELIEFMWGGDSEGGPLTVRKILNIYAHRLRKEGWPVKSLKRRGYMLVKSSH